MIPPEDGDSFSLSARKHALVRVAVGVPMLLFCLLALVVAFRVADRPLADRTFWMAVLALLAGFAVYFAKPLRQLLSRR